MIYRFLRWYTRWGIKFFYRNVFIFHKKKIDFNKSAILASNHPAGFYESIILTTILPKPVHFLVRSDYVNIKFLKRFFKVIKLLPIYRQSEGIRDVKKNNEVFDIISVELKNNSFIGIYPEGTTKYQFKVSPIKKGISRIILNAMEESIDPIRVVPVGFNFSDLTKFRSFLNIYSDGEIDFTKDDLSSRNKNMDLRKMTNKIENRLFEVNINIEDLEKQHLYKKVQYLLINEALAKSRVHSYDRKSSLPEKLVKLSQEINKLEKPRFEKFNFMVNQYFNRLKSLKINDFAVVSKKVTIINFMSLVFGFPVFLFGVLANVFPVLPGIFIVKKFTKQQEYKTALLVLISQVFYFIYFVVLLILSFVFFHAMGLVVTVLPFLAWYSVKYYDLLSDVFYSFKFKFAKENKIIREERNEILKYLPIVF